MTGKHATEYGLFGFLWYELDEYNLDKIGHTARGVYLKTLINMIYIEIENNDWH